MFARPLSRVVGTLVVTISFLVPGAVLARQATPAGTAGAGPGGVEVLAAGLTNPRGFIIVDKHQRNPAFPEIFALGVCVAIPPTGPTPVGSRPSPAGKSPEATGAGDGSPPMTSGLQTA